VTSSRRGGIAPSARPIAHDLDEQTELGGVYLRGLMRAQLRLGLLVLGTAAVAIGGLPLLILLVPSTKNLAFWGIPFPWLALGVAVYPVVAGLARWYVRASERIEAEFSDVVGRS
jgi:hypothetical protein